MIYLLLSVHVVVKTLNLEISRCRRDYKAVYTTEKMGTDPTRKEYGPHIFARVNFADHVFWHGYGPVFFFGFGAIDVYGPKTKKNTGPDQFLDSYASLRNNDCKTFKQATGTMILLVYVGSIVI